MPTKPPRPDLQIRNSTDKGICFDEQDSKEILHYIRRLERGYE